MPMYSKNTAMTGVLAFWNLERCQTQEIYCSYLGKLNRYVIALKFSILIHKIYALWN